MKIEGIAGIYPSDILPTREAAEKFVQKLHGTKGVDHTDNDTPLATTRAWLDGDEQQGTVHAEIEK